MDPYDIVIVLEPASAFGGWRVDDDVLERVLCRFVGNIERLNVSRVLAIGERVPETVRRVLGAGGKVTFHPFDGARPWGSVKAALEGRPSTVAVLWSGSIWADELLDELVDRHRRRRNQMTYCQFQPGFSPLITEMAWAQAQPSGVQNIEQHAISLIERRSEHGLEHHRRKIDRMNAYLRLDRPQGWAMVDRVSASDTPRAEWRVPPELQSYTILNEEKHRRSFGIVDAIAGLRDARVLDIGASPVSFDVARMLLDEYGVKSYVGINIDEARYEIPDSRATYVVGDAAEAIFDDDSFDVVLCISTWEHVSSPHKVFAAIPRYLRMGGVHYGQLPVWSGPHGYHLPPMGFHGGRLKAYSHLTNTPESLRAELLTRMDEGLVEEAVRRVYDDPYINRVGVDEFFEMIVASGMEPVFLVGRHRGRYHPKAEATSKAIGRRYSAEQLSVNVLEFLLRKSAFALNEVASGVLGRSEASAGW
jgi:SAM-dependent methyltransferase